jgi:MYXO-CTERM domain-containing protein
MVIALGWVSGLLLCSAAAHSDVGFSSSALPPLPIVGGTDATSCEWPAVVAMLEADETPVMCSGSLIHPEVVMTAAHCVIPERPIVGIGFGEAGQVYGTPARVIAPSECVAHPDYEDYGTPDVAYCRLAEAVEDVPIVPLLAGCETEVLQPGVEVTIVGFGATYGTYVDETVSAMGVGAKRYTTQTIDWVDDDFGEVNLVGPNGSQSACFGDSGGPSLVELSDGTWRVFGTGSHLYDPGGLPPPVEAGNVCGPGVAYGHAVHALDWLESETGVDLTPCWNGDDFVASADCGGFPLAPGTASGTWDDGCVGGAAGGGAQTCEPSMGDTGGESSSSSGGDGSSSSSGDGTTGVIADDSSSGGSTSSSTTTSADATGPVTTVSADGTGGSSESGSGEDDDAQGCGCAVGSSPSGAALLLLGLFARRRRARFRS